MLNSLPKISVVIVTLNNEKTLPCCLESIKNQDYPQELIEYVNIDGGSIDGTKELMEKYGFRVVDSPIKKNAEAQRAIGLREAKNEIIISLDADNYLPNPNWFRQMVQPFMEDKEIVYSQTLHYAYRKEDSLFNRYCALFGVSDPVAYYVGKPDRLSWHSDQWKLGDKIEDRGSYYKVEFSEKNLPTVGCNGIAVRKDILLNHANSSPEQFLHIDVYVDLIRNGYNKFAIVKNDVIHATANTLRNLMKKRIAFLSYYFGQTAERRYLIYNPRKIKDNFRMFLFVLYTVTFIKPFFDSLRGYLKIKDVAWFVHPIACWAYLYAYGKATVINFFKAI